MKYKHALCIYPHMKGAPEKKYFPPIGLEYIATALVDLVETVTLIDMRYENHVDDFLKDNNIDLVCLSVNWDYQREATLNLLDRIPSHLKIIMGGRYVTTHVEDFFNASPKIDIIVRGDGEAIIQDIVAGLPLKEITGISYCEDNKIIHNNIRDLSGIDEVKFPNRKLRRADYRLLLKNIDLGQKVDFISTSRGCPYNCKFCTFTNNPLGQKRSWSGRSASSVIAELKTIDANFIFVVDDNFAANMKRVEEICDLIIAEGIKKTFAVALRLEIYKHPEILKKMFNAGFKILTIGIESAQDKTLLSMQKGFDTAAAEDAFAEIEKINFFIHGYFIVGCIGESEAEMLEIASFAKRLKLDTIDVSLLRTEKYSPLNDVIAESTGYHVGEKNLIYSDKYSIKKLRKIRHRIKRSYYDFFTILRITKKVINMRVISVRYLLKLLFIYTFRPVISNIKK